MGIELISCAVPSENDSTTKNPPPELPRLTSPPNFAMVSRAGVAPGLESKEPSVPEYIPGRIVDRDHVICPDNRIRKWYPNTRDPFGYEKLFGLEYGRVKLSGNVGVTGWRKDSDARFIMEQDCVPQRFVEALRRLEMWLEGQKSQESLQVLAKHRREKMEAVREYEAIKAMDKDGVLTPPDRSFEDEDPLPLPY